MTGDTLIAKFVQTASYALQGETSEFIMGVLKVASVCVGNRLNVILGITD